MSQFEFQFQSLIAVSPLGLMYGSAGAFLSPENLVGKSGTKFPPETAALAGLLFHANREQKFADNEDLKNNLVVAGPFWAKRDNPKEFYVPIPWHQVIAKSEDDEWILIKQNSDNQSAETNNWSLNQYQWHRQNENIKPEYQWQLIDTWGLPSNELRENREDYQTVSEIPWKPVSFLHPKHKAQERCVVEQDGLFLENAVQLPEDYCLVYLTNSTHTIANSWYRFGGEGHLVELESYTLSKDHKINRLLRNKIHYACALITPGVWGSNRFSYRYPQHPSFPHQNLKLLTDKPLPYRYRVGQSRKDQDERDVNDRYMPDKTGRLSRGRYAIPSGSVYVFEQPLNLSWWDFPDQWFPKEGFYLKRLGCGLCLPINIQGVPQCTAKPTE